MARADITELEQLGATITERNLDGSTSTYDPATGRGVLVGKFTAIDLPSVDALLRWPQPFGRGGPRDFVYGSHLTGDAENAQALRDGAAPAALVDRYRDARDRLQPLIDKYAGMGTSVKRRRVRREDGAELDIDRAMVGDPQCWESRVRGKKKRVVRLAVQYSYVAAAKEQTFIDNAVLAAAASDVLTKLGYAVEIVAIYWARFGDRHGEEYLVTVPLKEAGQPFDARRVLTTGLPAMQRRFTWGLMERFFVQNAGAAHRPRLSDVGREHLGASAIAGQELRKTTDKQGFVFDRALENFLSDALEIIDEKR
jgi:hypothetical protein